MHESHHHSDVCGADFHGNQVATEMRFGNLPGSLLFLTTAQDQCLAREQLRTGVNYDMPWHTLSWLMYMHRDLHDDECWAQGARLRICTVIASLLLTYYFIYNMQFMQVDGVISMHT